MEVLKVPTPGHLFLRVCWAKEGVILIKQNTYCSSKIKMMVLRSTKLYMGRDCLIDCRGGYGVVLCVLEMYIFMTILC